MDRWVERDREGREEGPGSVKKDGWVERGRKNTEDNLIPRIVCTNQFTAAVKVKHQSIFSKI